ncbi:endonuclease-reverse transcriptase [Apostichopus japonicus]|uniref:Endonuclease-reverse transcriptase n=1 Tax=Stichopus japonicus TaxID=307972 RepID=A0A2G8KWH1_STIJA|nr:endonuclease-reverse transcriptase [Apostichopus japonicus]
MLHPVAGWTGITGLHPSPKSLTCWLVAPHPGSPSQLAGETTIRARNNTIIGTWNVRTLRPTGKLEELTHELDRYRWNILGLCEVRWKETGVISTLEGHKLIRANGEKLETVQSFKYLGAIVTDEGSKPEVLSRIAQTTSAVTKLKLIWKDRNITLRSKIRPWSYKLYSSMIRLMRSLVTSIFLYACESWTLTADIERRIQTVEMRCFRRLLNISYRDHISNQEVRKRIGQAIRPYDDLLAIVKKRKLRWYGHVTRSSGLAKTILQGTVPGGRRRGRQRKRWEDNIPEWTGLKLPDALREAEDRKKWK